MDIGAFIQAAWSTKGVSEFLAAEPRLVSANLDSGQALVRVMPPLVALMLWLVWIGDVARRRL
jgi:hypothetical protein